MSVLYQKSLELIDNNVIITTIPELRGLLDIEDCAMTINAEGTQKKRARKI